MVSSIDIDSLWDYNNPSASEQAFIKFRDKLIEENDTEGIKQVKTQIARTLGLQQKFREGHVVLNEIEYTAASSLTKIRYHLERGRLYNSDNKVDTALPEFQQAWELATKTDEHYYAVDAAHMIAIASKNTETQLSWNRTAIDYAENSSDERAQKWLGSLLNNTAWTYFDAKKYDEALDLFRKALDFRKEQGDEEAIRIAKWCIGRVYREMERYEEAIELMTQLEQEFTSNGLAIGGYTLEELAELYKIQGEEEKAKSYFKQAYDVLSQDIWLQKNEAERLKRLDDLSR